MQNNWTATAGIAVNSYINYSVIFFNLQKKKLFLNQNKKSVVFGINYINTIQTIKKNSRRIPALFLIRDSKTKENPQFQKG